MFLSVFITLASLSYKYFLNVWDRHLIVLYLDLETLTRTFCFMYCCKVDKTMHACLLDKTPFHNPTTNCRIRIPTLTFLFLAYGKCNNSHFLGSWNLSKQF